MSSIVTAVPPASPAEALAHFEACLGFETDCWDVHESMAGGRHDFILLDVRSAAAYASGHIVGAVNLPHREIEASTVRNDPEGKLYVVYCAGPHCNGAHRAALRLARLGRPVKIMIGGIAGWLDESFELEAGSDSRR